MKEITIYSIGHGKKNLESFINELKAYEIEYVLDVRSIPYSKRNQDYNKDWLKHFLNKSKIKYAYFGDLLGGLPSDRSCYNEEGKVLYDVIKERGFFKKGISRLLSAQDKGYKVAVMCSESKPEQCHRSKLIGQELLKHNISMKHIISDKIVKPQEVVMVEHMKGRSTDDLFGKEENITSRKSY